MRYVFFTGLLTLGLSFAAAAQQPKPTDVTDDGRQASLPQEMRVNVLRQLGLSPEQVQRIGRLNRARKPMVDEAQRRLRIATRALDEAIYADEVVETDVQARLKDFQLAQADVARLRFMNELAVRRILTKDQLTRFRELRRRFEARGATVRDDRPVVDARRAFQNARQANALPKRPDR